MGLENQIPDKITSIDRLPEPARPPAIPPLSEKNHLVQLNKS